MQALAVVAVLIATAATAMWLFLAIWGRVRKTKPEEKRRSRWKLTEDSNWSD